MKRSGIKPRRSTPRRRAAPQWSAAEWEAAEPILQARAAGRCECCGDALIGPIERHHRIRRRDGGDRIANLLILLRDHHAYWTQHPTEARDRGIILTTGTDPAEAPLYWRLQQWRTVDDEGGLHEAESRALLRTYTDPA